ncbi:PQQ-dependent sugar dehydrogenase [Alteraurantiacibacter aquimixticola]|nr:PQQ-dependent sugar dehydrogenase [Alteraurantiacibacter aquimixticola]
MAGTAVELEEGSPFLAEAYIDLDEGWGIAIEPTTGNLLITEKGGTAKYFNPATGTTLEVNGLPEVAYGGQGGLGDVAFAPDYAESGTVYLSWAKADEGEARRAVAGKGTFACDEAACTISGLTEIWQQDPAIESFGHFSHKIAFSPDGQHLFITSGDRMQQDPAQDLSNNLGKVLRLNLDGTPAAGNPFEAEGGVTSQIWSYGQRNLLGIDFDAGGQLWTIEHGPAGGDELNMVEPGNNYGWPVRSNGDNYDGRDIPDHTEDDGFVKPAIFWNPVIAPGDMVFYSGEMFPDWEGQLLVANLGTMTIARIATDAATGTATEEARYAFPQRLRDIAVAADGSLWVVEDTPDGRLLRLTAASAE